MSTPIRLALPADLAALTALYNQAIAAGDATADTVPFTVDQRLEWFQLHTPHEYPIYAYEQAGQVLAWLSVSPYRGRPALRRTAELSYYVDYAHHGRGIGSALLARALADAPRLRKQVYLAILLEWNTGSLRLLQKFCFEKWGYLPAVAELGGRLCGQFYYGKLLQAPSASALQ